MFARKDIFLIRPWMVDLRRASSAELRSALLRVKEHLPLSNTSGLDAALGQGSEVPPDRTSLLSMAARMCGSGTRAEQVVMESVDRIRLRRAPHMRYKHLLGNGVQTMGRVFEFPCRVAEEADSSLVRAESQEREFTCESFWISRPPYAPFGKEPAHLAILPEGSACASGIMRTLSRVAKDAVRVETPFLRVLHSRYG